MKFIKNIANKATNMARSIAIKAKSVIENISKNTTAFGQNVTPVTPACDPDEDDNDDEDDTILNYNRDC